MHLTSQMQRVTHETQNIKSMIANFKSDLGEVEMKRSKSGMGLKREGYSSQKIKFSKKQTRVNQGKIS